MLRRVSFKVVAALVGLASIGMLNSIGCAPASRDAGSSGDGGASAAARRAIYDWP